MDAVGLQNLAVSGQPSSGAVVGEGAGDAADAGMAQPDQMLRRQAAAQLVIGCHIVVVHIVDGAVQDDIGCGAVVQLLLKGLKAGGIGVDGLRGLEHEAVDAAALQKGDVVDAPLHLLVAVADEQAVVVEVGAALQTGGHFGIERIEHVRVDQADGVGLFGHQRNGDLIGHIVHLLRHALDPGPGLLGDAALFSTEDQRHRCDGDPCGVGDVTNGAGQTIPSSLR